MTHFAGMSFGLFISLANAIIDILRMLYMKRETVIFGCEILHLHLRLLILHATFNN